MTGFEPATFSLATRCSSQLSYIRAALECAPPGVVPQPDPPMSATGIPSVAPGDYCPVDPNPSRPRGLSGNSSTSIRSARSTC